MDEILREFLGGNGFFSRNFSYKEKTLHLGLTDDVGHLTFIGLGKILFLFPHNYRYSYYLFEKKMEP